VLLFTNNIQKSTKQSIEMKILIAEDEPLMLRALELKLKREGYEVILCCNGKEALNKIDQFIPDLIITDIMMPFSSGLDIVGMVKSGPLKRIPIIVLSAMGQEKIVEEAFEMGADDFVTKPFSLTELSLRIKRFVKLQPMVVAMKHSSLPMTALK
jgi:DNA-binding response OmpR family regulator